MIRVVATDDHLMVLRGLEVMLRPARDIDFVKSFQNGRQTLDQLQEVQPDVLLLDINLPDINGIDLCKTLRKRFPCLHIIALSNLNGPAFIKNMIKNGADGYPLKTVKRDELQTAIRQVCRNKQYLQKSVQQQLINDSIGISDRKMFIPKLTKREGEVLNLIAEEHTTNEIAEKLFVSPKTIECHRMHLIQKFAVRNTAGLMRIAIEKGLIK